MDSVIVMPVMVRPTRTLWGAGQFSRDRRAQCFSPDGKNAVASFADRPAQYPSAACEDCEKFSMQPWTDKVQDGWCSPGYVVAFISFDGEPFIMRLNGTHSKLAKVFAGRSIFRRQFMRVSTRSVANVRGNFYALMAHVERISGENWPAWFSGEEFTEWDTFAVDMPPDITDEQPDGGSGQGEGAAGANGAKAALEVLQGVISFRTDLKYVGVNGTPLWKAYLETDMIDEFTAQAGLDRHQLVAWGANAQMYDASVKVGDLVTVTGEWRENTFDPDPFDRDLNVRNLTVTPGGKLGARNAEAPAQPGRPTPPFEHPPLNEDPVPPDDDAAPWDKPGAQLPW